jgi:cyclophilin family peptidyl-prolyl cis-trans isomerase
VAKQAKRERQRLNREARRQAELAADRRRKQVRMGRNIAILAVPLIAVFVILQLRSSGGSEPERDFSKRGEVTLKPDTLYTATIDTSEGKMVVDLDATAAPESVKNFVFLARKNFYDGLAFHRVAKDFAIQGGDPKADGSGGPGYQTPVETPPNGYQVGSVAWAKGEQSPPGTAGSQFFVVTTAGPGLDGLNQRASPDTPYPYGIVGTVTPDTLPVAQKIGALASPNATDDPATQRPTKKITIKKVTIDEKPSSTAGSTPPAS